MKRQTIKITAILTTVCCVLLACEKGDAIEDVILPEDTGLKITPIENLNQGTAEINSHADIISRSSLKMNFRSYAGIGQGGLGIENPRYPRIKRMPNGIYIMFYHNSSSTIGASCDYALSQDLKKWIPRGKIFNSYAITDSEGNANRRAFATCDALVLANGDILAVASYRAESRYTELSEDAGLVIRRSKDNGYTWGPPIEIYQGINWEPYLFQLPSGEIHCYFTDSDRTFFEPHDTGTALVVSNDNGYTWTPDFGSKPNYVLRTAHIKNGNTYFNNQMPSIIKLNNSNELAAAMEANIGGYHISFAYSGDSGQWSHLAADEEGPADRNDLAFSGSAPYLRQFPSGETILSYNHNSAFHLKMGDAKARNFGENYSPTLFTGGYWGSLERIDDHQVIGVIPNTGQKHISLAKFVLNHRIHATERIVTVDGDNIEWEDTDEALFVGERSQAQATLRASTDNENVYFLLEVLDEDIDANDFASVFISPVTNNDQLGSGAYRLKVSYDGLREFFTYDNGWITAKADATVKTAYRGSISRNTDRDHGYIVEIAIPRSKLNIESGKVLVNFSITDNTGAEDAIFNTLATSTAKWIPVSGL